jgi:hypothetical protein
VSAKRTHGRGWGVYTVACLGSGRDTSGDPAVDVLRGGISALSPRRGDSGVATAGSTAGSFRLERGEGLVVTGRGTALGSDKEGAVCGEAGVISETAPAGGLCLLPLASVRVGSL